MDEETKTKESESSGTGKGSEPKSPTVIEQADASAKRLEEANKQTEELVRRQEDLASERALGGEAEAGAQPPEKKVLSDQEYAEAMERGEVNPFKEDGFV